MPNFTIRSQAIVKTNTNSPEALVKLILLSDSSLLATGPTVYSLLALMACNVGRGARRAKPWPEWGPGGRGHAENKVYHQWLLEDERKVATCRNMGLTAGDGIK